jgi:hypothetical protein
METEKLHECITVDIINHDRELGRVLGSRRQEIVALIETANHPIRTAARDIISGPLDADKLDYLLRDSYFCGVKYGVYDLDRVINGVVKIGAGEESFVGVKLDSLWAVEQHLMARYHMTIQVYRHRVRRSTDMLLARAILLAAEEGAGEIAKVYAYRGPKASFSSRWLRYTDNRLLDAITQQAPRSRAGRLLSAIRSRALSFEVLSVPLKQLPTLYRGKIADRGEQQELEAQIAKDCSMDRDRVIVDVVRTEPPRPSSSEPAIDPEEILVDGGRGGPSRFHEVSDIFTENPLKGRDLVTFYAPLTGKRKSDREKERKRLRPLVKEVIERRTKEVRSGR